MARGRSTAVFHWRRGALREIRNLEIVEEALLDSAQTIAKAAERNAGGDAEYVTDSQRVHSHGKDLATARAAVYPANLDAMLAEKHDRALTRAISAARSS